MTVMQESGERTGGRRGAVSDPPGERAPQLRRRAGQLVPPILVAVGLVAALELIYQREWVSPLVLPSPRETLSEIVDQSLSATMWSNLWVTTQEALLGFVIGSAGGIALGTAIALSRWMSRALYPYLVLLQSMPRIALVPVFVAMLGFGMGAKIVTAIVLCFFPPLINTIVGLRETDEEAMTLMRSLCATKQQTFRKLLWPSALPAVFGGLKTALTLAFLGAFVGELTASNEGAGLLIDTAASQLHMALLFAYVFWFSVISLVLYGLLEVVDNKVVFWKGEQRNDVFGYDA
jgi:NitT/TauT family transport system permease protein